jgi:hypothetical protein
MTVDTEPADLPAERLDKAVGAARKLCTEFRWVERRGRWVNGLPERSALRGLLNFAQSTPSTAEAILFVRYQASRLDPAREFLTGLADELETNWSASIDELRRFLGILVRAGSVAHSSAPVPPPSRGGREQPRRGGPRR